MTAFHDLWRGKWILLSRDGEPMRFTRMTVGYDEREVFDRIDVAAHVNEVYFFSNEETAERVRNQWPGWEMSLHRVQRLEVLDEKFSRGYVEEGMGTEGRWE